MGTEVLLNSVVLLYVLLCLLRNGPKYLLKNSQNIVNQKLAEVAQVEQMKSVRMGKLGTTVIK